MEAKARDLNFLANESVVRIPFFQRRYVWGKENWKELLSDLADTTRSHFLGSLILKQMDKRSGETNEVLVIDGQQRLTTLSLLLKALHDTLPAEVRPPALATLRPLLFFRKSALDPNHRVKIHHSRLDSEAFQLVIRSGVDAPPLPAYGPTSLILDAYRYFVTELSEWPVDARALLFNHLLSPHNKMLVVIDLEAADNEQGIFDTINSAGVRLSGADIIKNALYQRAIKVMGPDAAVELYDERWKAPFLADADTVAFWDTERLTGRVRRDNIEILLHAIAVIKGFYDPETDRLADLAARYKHEVEAVEAEPAVRAFAHEIDEYAKLYRKHLVAIDSTTALSFGDGLTRLLHILDVFQVSTLHPFLLFVLRQHPERAKDLFGRLERFVVRRVVAGHETKSFNKLAKELIEDPESIVARLAETTDADVSAGLRDISNKVAKVILFWIELARRDKDAKFDEAGLSFNYSLEHVMPQKWETYWPAPTTAPDGTPIPEDVAARIRKDRVYWLGNMTLLTSNLNSSLHNAALERKVNGDGGKKGMAHYGSLTITRRDVIEPFLAGDKVWNEAKIEARTLALEKEALAIWGSGGRV